MPVQAHTHANAMNKAVPTFYLFISLQSDLCKDVRTYEKNRNKFFINLNPL